MPGFDTQPDVSAPQKWKNYSKVKRALTNFYADRSWGVSTADAYEMKSLLRQWGDDPSVSVPDPREWPDLESVMPPNTRPRPALVRVPVRPPPLMVTPYEPLGLPRKKRGRGGGRRGRGGVGGTGGGRVRVPRQQPVNPQPPKRRRLRRVRDSSSDSSTSSENEFQIEPLTVRTDKPHVGDTFWDSDDEPRVQYEITSVGRKYVYTEHTRWLISDALPRVNRSLEHMYTNNS